MALLQALLAQLMYTFMSYFTLNPAFPVYCNEAGGTTPIAS